MRGESATASDPLLPFNLTGQMSATQRLQSLMPRQPDSRCRPHCGHSRSADSAVRMTGLEGSADIAGAQAALTERLLPNGSKWNSPTLSRLPISWERTSRECHLPGRQHSVCARASVRSVA